MEPENRTYHDTDTGKDVTKIGGVVDIEDAEIRGLEKFLPKAESVADSEATTVAALKEDFNDLLGALRAAGLMEEESE